MRSINRRLRGDRTFIADSRTFMGPADRERAEARIRQLQAILKGDNQDRGYAYTATHLMDKRAAARELRSLNRNLENHLPPELSGKEKDILARRAKNLERKITNGMLTKDELMGERMRGENGKIGYKFVESSVRREMDWSQNHAGDIKEWKQIQRALDPMNPDASNLERLRKGH